MRRRRVFCLRSLVGSGRILRFHGDLTLPSRARKTAGRMSGRTFQRFGVVAAAALVAAALRFWPLDGRSYWRDEAFTVDLVRLPFAEMLDEILRSEGTPPGYYVVAWAWARLFGSSEAGLRSLSALCGVLTVVAIYVTADRLFSRRVAGIAAFVAATSPLLVWYGQEARSYGLGLLAVSSRLPRCRGSLLTAVLRRRSGCGPVRLPSR